MVTQDYGGANTFVGAIYSYELDLAGYVTIQALKRPTLGQLDPELHPIALDGKLQRLEGWAEGRALSHSLSLLGFGFESLRVPPGLLARPVEGGELRVKAGNNEFFVYNQETGGMEPEIPRGLNLHTVKALVSISDQGGSNRSALQFLAYSKGPQKLLIGLQWDPFHRAWNDLKASMKKCTGYFWKMVLSLSIFYNCPYGPFNSGQWASRKTQAAKDFFERHGPFDEAFQSFIPYICWEQNLPEPVCNEEVEALYYRVQDAPHWTTKGPLVKLMRWLSFFQSSNFYKGDHFSAKMVMQKGDLSDLAGDSGDEGVLPTIQTATGKDKSVREELADLKKTKGTWKAACKVVNVKYIQQKDIMGIISHSTCTHHSEDARELLTAHQILAHTCEAVKQQGWAAELAAPLPSVSSF